MILFSSIIIELSAQSIINEGFESGSFNPFISFQTVGSYNSAPGIIENNNFGSTRAFSFGKSSCSSSCFDNYKTTLIITFPAPTYVDSIKWKEMEIVGNWGSQGQVFLDDVVFAGATLGAMPVNSGVPDASPQLKNFSVNQTVTTIKFVVNDITNASEIILDDLQITYTLIPKIAGYEYWFNTNYANKTSTSVAQTEQLLINQLIPTTGLTNGINTFNFRTYDNLGMYSTVLSHFFYKLSTSEINATPQIVAYEYWLNNDYANAVVVNTPIQQQVNISELIPMNSLSTGIHNFNIRFKDNTNLWSSVLSNFFYKTSASQNNTNPQIVAYEYWIDNDYANAIVVNTPIQQYVNINELITTTSLNNGVHHFNIRFKDNNNTWSSVLSHFFYKTPINAITQNKISAYRYWFDDNFEQAVKTTLTTPLQQLNVVDNLDATRIPKGAHTVHFQFADSLGQWSSVTTDSITKIAFPIADFTYSLIENCDSTIVSFNNNSMDADSIWWTFGNGDTDSNQHPDYTYKNAGVYTITLLAKDTLSGLDSLKIIELPIKGNTYFALDTIICNSYTSPSGRFTWVNSGNYSDTLSNTWGCDSLLTIQLQVKPAYSIWETVSVCEGSDYTMPDGSKVFNLSSDLDYTSALQTTLACDSIIYTHLSVVHIDTTVVQNGATLTANQEGASYRWVDCELNYADIAGANNKIFTATQNGNYAAIISISSCSDTTSCFAVTTIAIKENSFNQEIKMYPNPVQDYLHLTFENTQEKVEITICDIQGKQLESKQYVNITSLLLNVQHLQQGNYILQVKAGNKEAHYKILKK